MINNESHSSHADKKDIQKDSQSTISSHFSKSVFGEIGNVSSLTSKLPVLSSTSQMSVNNNDRVRGYSSRQTTYLEEEYSKNKTPTPEEVEVIVNELHRIYQSEPKGVKSKMVNTVMIIKWFSNRRYKERKSRENTRPYNFSIQKHVDFTEGYSKSIPVVSDSRKASTSHSIGEDILKTKRFFEEILGKNDSISMLYEV